MNSMANARRFSGAAFIEYSVTALERVFGLIAIKRQVVLERGLRIFSGEKPVVSLRFRGDMQGQAVLLLDGQGLEDAAAVIMERYALKTAVMLDAVFAELLNMYAGQLLMELSKDGFDLELDPPDALARVPGHQPGHTWSLRMPTKEGITLVMCYTIEREEHKQ